MLQSSMTGLWHATDAPDVVELVDRFQAELMCYGREAAAIAEAPARDPGFAVGHALAAALQLFTLSPAGVRDAAPHLAAARRLADGATPRERLLVDAIGCWAEGRIDCALRLHLEIAGRWPRDLVSARIAQYHQLNRGDFAGMRRLAELLVGANPDVPAVKGMLAFALEQTGETGAAERLGRAAADAGFDPWAEHAVAHALERQGRSREGLDFLRPRGPGWDRCSSFLYTHNWWHVALFHLELGETGEALALFDQRVWGVRKAYCQDQANAVSLLARLELKGAETGARWLEVGEWLKPRTGEHLNGLMELHYAYGLARAGAGPEVDRLLGNLKAHGAASMDLLWREVVPVAAEGVVAHARGRLEEAGRLLGQVVGRLQAAGGSSTQRHLFTLLYHDALARG